jgi:hypothetical protein
LPPDKVIGAGAADFLNDPYLRPRCLPLGQFDDNVAHGNFETGFQIDNFLTADGNTEEGSYNPKLGPFDPLKPCFSSGSTAVCIILIFFSYF